MAEPAESAPAEPVPVADAVPAERRSDHSSWNWLLIIPIVLPLLTFIYNRESPRLWGFPFFYWYQFLWVFVASACTWVAFQLIARARRGNGRPGSDRTDRDLSAPVTDPERRGETR